MKDGEYDLPSWATVGARMPPKRAKVEHMPTAEFRIDVGNNSAVYKKTFEKAADEPNFPTNEKRSLMLVSLMSPAQIQEIPQSICTNIRNGLRPNMSTDCKR